MSKGAFKKKKLSMPLYSAGCASFRADNEYIGPVRSGWTKIAIADVIEPIKNGGSI